MSAATFNARAARAKSKLFAPHGWGLGRPRWHFVPAPVIRKTCCATPSRNPLCSQTELAEDARRHRRVLLAQPKPVVLTQVYAP